MVQRVAYFPDSFHEVNGGRTPVKFRLVEARFMGDPIPLGDPQNEAVLFPGRLTETALEIPLTKAKAGSLHGATGLLRFEYHKFDEQIGASATHFYLREFTVDVLNNRLIYTREDTD